MMEKELRRILATTREEVTTGWRNGIMRSFVIFTLNPTVL
jgi:hypothetical protein